MGFQKAAWVSKRLPTLLRFNTREWHRGEAGRCCGSVRASGSQQVQNKLLVLAWGSFLPVCDPLDFYPSTFSIYGCQLRSVLMLPAILKKLCKNEPLDCEGGKVFLWQYCCFRTDIQPSPCKLHFFFQQFLILTTNTAAMEVTTLCLPATKKKYLTSISVAGKLTMNTCEQFLLGLFLRLFHLLHCGLNPAIFWISWTPRQPLAATSRAGGCQHTPLPTRQ